MGNSKRVLIIDDEQGFIDLLCIELQQANYEVISALDGLEGLQLARDEMPDLIILDVMLPKLDGFQICRMLKFDEHYRAIPIILLTAKGQQVDQETSEEVKADCYLNKPFESEVLLNEISRLVGD